MTLVLIILLQHLVTFRYNSLLESLQEHIIVNLVDLLLQNVLTLLQVIRHTQLHQTVNRLYLYPRVLVH